MPDYRAITQRGPTGSALRDQLTANVPDNSAALAQADAYTLNDQGQFDRGLTGGAYGLTAGSYANDALQAELAQDPTASPLRNLALQNAQTAERVGPTIKSYHDVHGLGDAVKYGLGQLGEGAVTMAPLLAVGLATRGKSIGEFGNGAAAYLGEAWPAYKMMKGNAALAQYQDPTLAKLDPTTRDNAAMGEAAVNTVGASLVPGALARKFGHAGSALGTLARAAGEQAVIAPGMAAVSEIGQEAARQGALNSTALQAPLDPKFRDAQYEAALSGAIQGAGLAAPTAGSHLLANAATGMRDRAVEAGKAGLDAAKTGLSAAADATKAGVSKAADVTADVAGNLGNKLKDFSDAQLADHIDQTVAPKLVPDNPAEQALGKAVTPEAVMAAQPAHEASLEPHARQVAQNVLDDEHAPPELKQSAMATLAGQTPRELLGAFVDKVKGIDTERLVNRVKDTATSAIDTTRSAIKDFADKPIGGVPTMITNKMRATLESSGISKDEIGKLTPQSAWDKIKELTTSTKDNAEEQAPPDIDGLFKQLKPEFTKDPDVRGRLAPLAQVLSTLADAHDEQAPARATYATMQKLAPALDLFADPTKVLPKELVPVYEAATRAQTEAKSDDSWFTTGLKPEYAAKPEVRAELARIVDRAAVNDGRTSADQKALLARAMGSPAEAADMIAHYAGKVPKLEGPAKVKLAPEPKPELAMAHTTEAHDAESGEANVDHDAAQQGMREVSSEEAAPKVSYKFADTEGKRPFAAPRDVATRRGARQQMQLDIRRQNELNGGSERSRLVTLAQMADEAKLNDTQLAGHVQAFADAHEKQVVQDAKRSAEHANAIANGKNLSDEQVIERDAIKARAQETGYNDALLEAHNYDHSKKAVDQPDVVKALAGKLHVIRTERAVEHGGTGLPAADLYAAGRKLMTQARKTNTQGPDGAAGKAFQQKVKSTQFKVWRKVGDSERPTTLSAASLLKAARGHVESTGENAHAFTKRLFTEALGDLATGDKSIVGIGDKDRATGKYTLPHDLVLDIDTGQMLGPHTPDADKIQGSKDNLVHEYESIRTMRDKLSDYEQRAEDLVAELMDAHRSEGSEHAVRDELHELVGEVQEHLDTLNRAMAMVAPDLGETLYKQRQAAELPRSIRNQIADGYRKAHGADGYKAAAKNDAKLTAEHATSESLRLAAQTKEFGKGGTASIKRMRDEVRDSLTSIREMRNDHLGDQRFGDTTEIDKLTEMGNSGILPSKDEIRTFDDFGKQLHPKTDNFGPAAKDRGALTAQAKRAYESMAAEKAKLWKGVSDAVMFYITKNVLPERGTPVEHAAQMRAIMGWINASGPHRATLEAKYRSGAAMGAEAMAAKFRDQMINDARTRVADSKTQSERDATRRQAAADWVRQHQDYLRQMTALRDQARDEVTATSKAKGQSLANQIQRRLSQLVEEQQLVEPQRVPAGSPVDQAQLVKRSPAEMLAARERAAAAAKIDTAAPRPGAKPAERAYNDTPKDGGGSKLNSAAATEERPWFQSSIAEMEARGDKTHTFPELEKIAGKKLWDKIRENVNISDLVQMQDMVGTVISDTDVHGYLKQLAEQPRRGSDEHIAELAEQSKALAEQLEKQGMEAAAELRDALPADPRADALVAHLAKTPEGLAKIREALPLMRSRAGLMRLFVRLHAEGTPATRKLASEVYAHLAQFAEEIARSGLRQAAGIRSATTEAKRHNQEFGAVASKLSGNALTDVMQKVRDGVGVNARQRAMLAELQKQKSLADVRFGYLGHSDLGAAFFDPTKNAVMVDTHGASKADAIDTLIHEVTHAATIKGEAADGVVRRDLNLLLNHVRDYAKDTLGIDIHSLYGMSETQEFLAEAFSNRGFQELLRKIPALNTETYKSAWQQFIGAVARVLGMKDVNALSEALTLGFRAADLAQHVDAEAGTRILGNAESNVTGPGVKFNEESVRESIGGLKMDKTVEAGIKAEITRMLGKDGKLEVADLHGKSGEYNPVTGIIRVAHGATNPFGVTYHEAFHQFLDKGLSPSEIGRTHRAGLLRAGGAPEVRAQLAEFFKGQDKVLASIESNEEERAAYAFQLWALGKNVGKEFIKIGPAGQNIFTKVAAFIRQALGVVSNDERAEQVFQALYDGKYMDKNLIASTLEDQGLLTLGDKIRRVAGPVADVNDKMMLVATDRLRNFGHTSLDTLATMFAKEPGREEGKAAFLQRRAQSQGQWTNKMATMVFDQSTVAERKQAAIDLAGMKTATTPLEKNIRALLDGLHQYQIDKGVKKFNADTKKWEDLHKIPDYFPRKWDSNAILKDEAGFRALMQAHGVSADQALQISNTITRGNGTIPLDNNKYQLGYTPLAEHIQDRKLSFINKDNAHEFVKYQSTDIADVLGTYISQAVHRAEFAQTFGNDGHVIDELISQAKLEPGKLAEANNTVKALIGTLGSDMNPRMKDVMGTIIAAENLILLPLTIFSNMGDALGVGLRANSATEAWNAFKGGLNEIGRSIANKPEDYNHYMAKTLGVIEDAHIADSMGSTHASSFLGRMSKDLSRKFFRINGMEAWNRGMRVSAMVAGERFMIREVANDRYMRELGLSHDDVMPMKDGRLAMTVDQMKMVDPKLDDGTLLERERRVQEAMFRFVDGAVLRPNAANRPVWGSDPHWMLAFHLKQYSYTFQKTILARVSNEMANNNVVPVGILAAYVPVIMATSYLKAIMTGQPTGHGSLLSTMAYNWNRSGIMGARSFQADAVEDLMRGQIPGTSFMGPSLQHAWLAGRYVVGDPTIGTRDLLDHSLPLLKYAPHPL